MGKAVDAVRVGLLGLGTVGAGTVNVLRRNADEIARRAGRGIRVVRAAVRDPGRARSCDLAGISVTGDPGSVIGASDVDVIVELIGGIEPALELVHAAIEHGKHVVTANKALIALHGNEVFSHAQRRGAMVAFEAAVAGGIPVIKAIREGLSGNRIAWLAGIINGTGNFILSEMQSAGREFAEVLAEAQALGYAEADPTYDIEGIDAAHKLAILASIAFGNPLQFDRVFTEGISHLNADDIRYAAQLGYRIKHLGIAKRSERGIEMRVHPALIPARQVIANVDGVLNAVLVQGDAVGPTLYSGAGAGAEPTASAVVADLVDVVRMLTSDPENRVPHLAFQPQALGDERIVPMEEVVTGYYLRMLAEDRPGVLAEVSGILAREWISIEAMVQREPREETHVDLVMLTHPVEEGQMNRALQAIGGLSAIRGPVMRVRVETLDND